MPHPVGMLESVSVPVHDHHLTCFTAPVGSPSHDGLRLLPVPCLGARS